MSDPRLRTTLLWLGVMASAVAQGAAAQPSIGWRTDGTGNYPLAEAPIEWSPTHNVQWVTPMPSWSNSSPILVGDRLLALSEPDTLLCLSAAHGQLLWQQRNRIEDAVPSLKHPASFLRAKSREQQVRPALRDKEYELLRHQRRLVEKADDSQLQLRVQALKAEVGELREELAALASALRPRTNPENGFTSTTPTSDGESVFVLFGTGVVASYDLDGHRRWIRFIDQPQVADGLSASPVLVGNKLLIQINDLIALDQATGEILWRTDIPARHGTPIAFEIQEQDLVITPSGHCVRVADGAVLARDLGDLKYASPLIHGQVLYMIGHKARAFRIPQQVGDALEFEALWNTQMKGQRYYGSPLLVDGLVYAVTRRQILSVLRASNGRRIYAERLSLGEMGGANSVYASPTQGGKYVFLSGLGGRTLVLEASERYQEVAVNELEKFRGSPIFAGDRMYVRGHEKFHCIAGAAD